MAKVVDKEAIKRGKKFADLFENNIKEKVKKASKNLTGLSKHGRFNNDDLLYIKGLFEKNKFEKISDIFLNTEIKFIYEDIINDKFKKQFIYMLDKINKFSYTTGWMRRTVRSNNYSHCIESTLKSCADGFISIGLYETDICSIIKGEFNQDLLAYKMEYSYNYHISEYVIAAELDSGNKELEILLEDIIMSENNVISVTTSIIRGIIMSDNFKLHKLLGDFLLAAKLQEGIRQAICENMDCGTIEAFKTILEVINQNDLIRFSSVKRAVCTWTGICPSDFKDIERIPAKIINTISLCINDDVKRREFICSNDVVEIYIALWTYGFYNVEDVYDIFETIISEKNRNRIMVSSLYFYVISPEYRIEDIAVEVVKNHFDDIQVCACYMKFICENGIRDMYERTEAKNFYNNRDVDSKTAIKKRLPRLTEKDKQLYLERYEVIKKFFEEYTQKIYKFEECIFPWNIEEIKRSDLAEKIAYYAFCLDDIEKLEYASDIISETDTWQRNTVVYGLLSEPKSEKLKKVLYNTIGDKAEYGRKAAFKIADSLPVFGEFVPVLEDLMKFKSSEIRTNSAKMLLKQDDLGIEQSIERLLLSKKLEQRISGLDLIMRIKRDNDKINLYEKVKVHALKISTPTDKEKVIIEEILGDSQADKVLSVEGYGIYNPKIDDYIPKYQVDNSIIKKVFGDIDINKLEDIKKKLIKIIDLNGDREYKNAYGEEVLLKNQFTRITWNYQNKNEFEMYPFPELWTGFYEEVVVDFHTLLKLYIYTISDEGNFDIAVSKIFGKDYLVNPKIKHLDTVKTVIHILVKHYSNLNFDEMHSLSVAIYDELLKLSAEESIYVKKSYGYNYINKVYESAYFYMFTNHAFIAKNDEEFKECFALLIKSEMKKIEISKEIKVDNTYNNKNENAIFCNGIDLIKACSIDIISKDQLYKFAFDYSIEDFVRNIAGFSFSEKRNIRNYRDSGIYIIKDEDAKENSNFKKLFDEIYKELSEMILKVELKRSDLPTPFSKAAINLSYIEGIDYLIEIIVALGEDVLSKNVYYYSSENEVAKNNVLSSLLLKCKPKEDDNVELFREKIKCIKITEKRLVEIAMFNTSWIDIIEEYLAWDGFKSGIYYFAAHLNEAFDNVKSAIISKYTPLTPEELNSGCFDIKWFNECYSQLGKERFKVLYDSAKYISDGNKHTRARKFADAVLGNVSLNELEKQINDKRNKDLLMSYALVPVLDDSDTLKRYKFIQRYLKESKKFGAQRRASEALAVNSALINLATNSGYVVVTRLVLNMETKLAEEFAEYFEFKKVEDILVKIEINENGKAEIICLKNDKPLKSIPSKLAKNQYILEIKDAYKQFREQYSRTKLMMEQFMEDKVEFTFSELLSLHKNPVISSIIRDLLFICDEKSKIGFITSSEMKNIEENIESLDNLDLLRPVHPIDLYKNKIWDKCQKYLFDKKIQQPFKQVFRELYVKTQDEIDKYNTLRYSGNQIQPKKAAACLKSRRWIADIENGLQKVYYKENIIARIYAVADWFSPADMECPCIEWVEFGDRKTGKEIKIDDIPNIIFSEVMRDVDLAVSVAHVGGVDPETSHSTVDMRKAIIEFNLPLFGIENVYFTDKHAHIKGHKANYTVHLGSGVVFVEGGSQIAIIAVHSQHRGKLFIPFIDEDPKTAEIMTKIIMFAEDLKIKDPYILNQI